MGHRNGQAYSQDLRDRVFEAVDDGFGVYDVAGMFRVSASYIYRVLARRHVTGETSAGCSGGGRRSPKLQAHEAAIGHRIAATPDTTIAELRAWLLAEHGVSASYGTVWKTLARLRLTYKKSNSVRQSKIVRMSYEDAKNGGRNKSNCRQAD